ncbi:DUF1236 domain-containing protein [Hoeflea sp. YIM 152468]|uniref:DUF1236 domain-containing protein n=1 Tax=Hoeflea sp. YIM 152468 TaxID=3031759 RepID=UPI0023DB629C|nr:DUF1236 domain-containing protein [Hoeflea sp. YIM 152468]MDF1609973.1 DUF1236 domain-containing protein [Hoeflea sp. YIM 152468]
MRHAIANITAAGLCAALLSSTAALAGFTATATTDLNIRSGPGPQHQVVGAIAGSDTATVNGCIEGSKWCQVTYNGTTGWSYSDYLSTDFSGQQAVISKAPQTAQIPVLENDQTSTNATVGIAGGVIAGALIGGPVGAAIGGVAGAAVGTAVSPPPTVKTYVMENRIDPVYLDGEVVIGAGIPDTVELRPVPDYEYRYVYINGQPVLVDAGTRQIVHVYR